jgi:dolichol-phosphate mannosyltransferase
MIFILLPAYNEEVSFFPMITKLKSELDCTAHDYTLIICDDGSTDGTAKILSDYCSHIPLEIITHKINRGLGESARDLFEKAIEIGKLGDYIVRMDCDNTHDPVYLHNLIGKIEEGYDVAVASRFAKGGSQIGLTTYRNFISRAANLFMKIFFPIHSLKEYSCGYRAYTYEIIDRAIKHYGNNFIQLKGLGFTCTLEKLVKLKLIGAKFAEIPFIHRYDQKKSESKMISSVTTLGYLVMTILYYWPWGGWRKTEKSRKN